MNRSRYNVTVILLALACSAFPLMGHSQDKGDDKETVKDAAAKNAEAEAEEEIVPITIGSPAPKLDIEHWIQDGEGHFAKVSEFESGKVYIVEFWATWCGPCISAMPHIAALQRSYADRGVQVVSITREDVEKVESFLDREFPGGRNADDEDEEGDDEANPQTYRELTSGYCLVADPDGSSSRDYMRAANRSGIPCAFLVGKDAKIEWIGHPMVIEEPLEKVVTDTWDRDAFAVEYVAEQEAREIFSKFVGKMRARETDEAIAILDDYIANGQLESEKAKFRTVKFQVLASEKDRVDEASDYALELLADETMDASTTNRIAWTVYRLAEMGRMNNEKVLKTAMLAARNAIEDSGPTKPFLLDTVAHLQYVSGDRESAIETQRAAIKAAKSSDKRRLTKFLEQLEDEIKAEQEAAEEEQAKKERKNSDERDEK